MIKAKPIAILGMVWMIAGALTLVGSVASAQVTRMDKETLKDLLGKSEVIVIDVRQPAQWDESPVKITGAKREDPGKKTETWAMKYPREKTIVFY